MDKLGEAESGKAFANPEIVQLLRNVPRYWLANEGSKFCDECGLSNPVELKYQNQGMNYRVVYFPADIKDSDGCYRSYFLGDHELTVQKILKNTIKPVDPQVLSTYSFKMSALRDLLGMLDDPIDLELSLEKLSSCSIRVYLDDKQIYEGRILSESYFSDADTCLAKFGLLSEFY